MGPVGKVISKSVLKNMLERYEPMHGSSLPAACKEMRQVVSRASQKRKKAQKPPSPVAARHFAGPVPQYIGINVDESLGGTKLLRDCLWAALSEKLSGTVDPSAL